MPSIRSGRIKLHPAMVLCVALTLAAVRSSAQEPALVPHGQAKVPGAPLGAAEAARAMTVPPGFSVEVVASEPNLVNPVAMAFDERGRVWVVESLEYPRRSPGPGKDRVKIMEDTDGDGAMDKFTIFADGLNIPSGIAVGYGGVWVANSPDILFLKDTDGDDKADTREVIVTGFGRFDTHELPNSLTWGPDGWLYGWNGVFNPAHINHRGKTFDFTCAIFRIHPRTRDFEVFCEGTSNPWGLTFDPEGSAFASACVIDHLWNLAETGYYHRQGGPYPPFTWKIESIVNYKHQQAAYCGIQYSNCNTYPEEFRGGFFIGNIHGNAINFDRVDRNGSTYAGRPEQDFLQANDAWFMPVAQKIGPDGSLYVLDWYDRYHCYQDANRDPEGIDRLKGRLYRVRYKDAPRAPKLDMARESTDRLIEQLASPNGHFRDTAQRLLTERNEPAITPKLERLVLDESASRPGRMHALWTLVGSGPLEPAFHTRLLGHPDRVLRAWGVRAAGNARTTDESLRKQVVALATDPALDVVLQVAIAARKIEGIDAVPLLVEIIGRSGDDPALPRVAWQNLHPLLEAQGERFASLVVDKNLVANPAIAEVLPRAIDRLLGRARPSAETAAKVALAIFKAPDVDDEVVANTLGVLTEGYRRGGPQLRAGMKHELGKAVAAMAADPDSPVALDAALLSATWGDPAGVAQARASIGRHDLPDDRRLDALNALVGADPRAAVEACGTLLASKASADLRGRALSAMGSLDDPAVATLVLARFHALEPQLKPRAVELLTQRPAWCKALLEAVAAESIPAGALDANQIRKLAASKDPTIAPLVLKHFGSVREARNPAREQVINQMRTFLIKNKAKGKPEAGLVAFRKVCAQCHKIYGEGQEVGPEITRNGRGSFEQLLSNVFDPSLVIGTAYQATTVAVADGRVLAGLLVEESPQAVSLKLQGGKVEVIPRAEVEEVKRGELSLMPEAIEGQLTPQEILDLFAFITLDRPPTDPEARPIPGSP
jgi:putative membrane-bound dehydrogenase-like protein